MSIKFSLSPRPRHDFALLFGTTLAYFFPRRTCWTDKNRGDLETFDAVKTRILSFSNILSSSFSVSFNDVMNKLLRAKWFTDGEIASVIGQVCFSRHMIYAKALSDEDSLWVTPLRDCPVPMIICLFPVETTWYQLGPNTCITPPPNSGGWAWFTKVHIGLRNTIYSRRGVQHYHQRI